MRLHASALSKRYFFVSCGSIDYDLRLFKGLAEIRIADWPWLHKINRAIEQVFVRSPLRTTNRTRHTKPNHICDIMGVQERLTRDCTPSPLRTPVPQGTTGKPEGDAGAKSMGYCNLHYMHYPDKILNNKFRFLWNN
jgi:hypothetical protein